MSSFASPQLQQVAGLSPFTVAGMNLVPFTPQTTAPEQSLFGMQPVWQDLMNRAVGLSQPSAASQSAIGSLLGSLGIPGGNSGLSPFVQGGSGTGQAAPLPFAQGGQLPQSVFGPAAPMTIPSISEVVPSMPMTPLMPTSPIAAPQAAQAAQAAPGALFRDMLGVNTLPIGPGGNSVGYDPEHAQRQYDLLVSMGHPPQFAAEEARRQATQVNYPGDAP